ncbi:MAG: hypothetical protein VX438_09650 [Planctomycetota bacterium]|nr:hypothetical protein [Planctomycetota bacterium]
MEHSLHKELKSIYCCENSRQEVVFGEYRIDVVSPDGTLVEIQHSSLSAIKQKCQHLLAGNQLLVVKPIIRRKQLVKLDRKGGNPLSSRKSPKQGNWLSVFEELVYFTDVFPSPNLTMEFLLVDIREIRYPGHGRRRRKRESDFQVQDLELIEIVDRSTINHATDLFSWLPFEKIPREFDSNELADAMNATREEAQRIAYCLRETGAVRLKGKRGRSNLYQRPIRRVVKKKQKPIGPGD